ncbi:unnamed protein product [Durusdinium trenchii]|uniref:Uncharacterized protein n=2 Tax=Durusdinium trenchii TaxID=1381693 RepID=A0ABP0S4N4_9DINO
MPPPRMGAMRALHSVLLVVPLLATEHCEPNADWLLQTAVQLQTAANGLYHQVLRNEDDAIYTASVRCGQQELRAIPDTGSSELVVFAEGCKGCGAAVETGYKPSTSVEVGHLVQLITYGSGSVLCREVTDLLEIGPLHGLQAMWLVEQADMSILQQSNFQAIMGLGPIALAETLQDLRKLHEIAETLEAHHLMSPFLRHRLKEQQQAHLELASLNDSVPATLHLRFLSVCLERPANSPGHLIWHDLDPTLRSEPFRRLTVVGSISWALQLKDLRLRAPNGTSVPLACSEGCGALLDTGTSLISAPTAPRAKLAQLLEAMGANCLDQETWPILEFQLGGEHLSLSAQALLGMVKGLMPLPWRSSYQQHPFVVVEACELLVMDTGDINTEWGPLWILGMPFFRQYYTTFDYGAPKSHAAGRTPPAVWVAESTEQCTPRAASTHVQLVQHGPVQVDLAKLRLPEWMANRANRSHINL